MLGLPGGVGALAVTLPCAHVWFQPIKINFSPEHDTTAGRGRRINLGKC